ncbi:MAG: M48 family metalloprotease [Myxococcaceae bacterium]|nr:M48 family metalloprotease [Myxococcaceae bacterium]
MADAFLTAAELADIKAYHAPQYTFGLLKLVLSGALAWGLVAAVRPLFALGTRVGEAVARRVPLPGLTAAARRLWGGPGLAAALGFVAVLSAIDFAAYLPGDVYFGFVREQAFGLSTQAFSGFAADYLKATLLTNLALAAVAVGLFGLARRLRAWWVVLAVVCSGLLLVSAAIDPYRARLYFKQHPLEAGPLRERITALMAEAHIDFADVLVEETQTQSVRVQAYFAGQGPTRTIVLNDALLEKLSPDEVLAAVAHEAGHVGEPRWPRYVGSVLALTLFLALIELLLRTAAARGWWGITARGDVRVLPLILALFWLGSMLVAPVAGALQRGRELEADRFGVALTKDPAAFRGLFEKVTRINKLDPDPPRWVVLKGWSHPPVSQRLAQLDALAR